MTVNNDDEDVYLKYNVLTHSNKKQKIFGKKFLQKYINFAKQLQPKLTKRSTDKISKEWTKLRCLDLENLRGSNKIMPITIRTLETIIRLATAVAKLKLVKEVTEKHVEIAVNLLRRSLFSADGETAMDIEEESLSRHSDNSDDTSLHTSKTESPAHKQSRKRIPRRSTKKSAKKTAKKSTKKSTKKSPKQTLSQQM